MMPIPISTCKRESTKISIVESVTKSWKFVNNLQASKKLLGIVVDKRHFTYPRLSSATRTYMGISKQTHNEIRQKRFYSESEDWFPLNGINPNR